MKLKSLAIIALGLICSTVAFSQEKVDSLDVHEQRISNLEDGLIQLKKLKFSGYVQSEWQMSQIDVNGNASQDMKVGGGANAGEKAAAVATPGSTFNRFGVRRGRLKATYSDFGCTGVVYIDATEKGVVVKEAYASGLDPWLGVLTLKGGLFNRPFGYEIEYSSSSRESPERSRIIQTLFPSERDLGAMVTLQAPKTSPWNVLKLDLGLLAGNALGTDTKSQKDLVAHLTYNNSTPTMKYGIGASLYNGVIFTPTKYVYTMSNNVFSVDSTATNLNGYAPRQYIGFDGQFSISTPLGLTKLSGEYIFGKQTGSSSSTSSPSLDVKPTAYGTAPTAVVTADAFTRNFAGGYIHFVQDIADTQHSIMVKYDWYDPNTDVAGDNIGAAISDAGQVAANKLTTKSKPYVATSKADIAYSTLGIGYMYRMNNNIKFMVYYDMPVNETTSALAAAGNNYSAVLAANLLTVRMQVKF